MIETQNNGVSFTGFPRQFDWPAMPFGKLSGHAFHLNKAFAKLYSDRSESLSPEGIRYGWHVASPLTRSEYLFNRIHLLLQEYLPDKEDIDILEVGCGSGDFCGTLLGRGYRTFGIDHSHSSLKAARLNVPGADFERASCYESLKELFGHPFDAIVSLDAIEHLLSPQRFIHQVVESLAPGGLFVISARFQGQLVSLLSALSGRAQADFLQQIDGSVEDEAPTTLGRLLEDSGLEIVEFQGAGHLPSQWRWQLFVARKPG